MSMTDRISPRGGGTRFHRLSALLETASTVVGVVVFCVMVVAVWLEVFYRYLLLNPLPWTDELAVYCMIWMGYLGIGVGLKHGEHPALQFLVGKLPPGVRCGVRRAISAGVLIFLAAATIWGFQYAVSSGGSRLSWALGISMTLPMLAIPVGGLLGVVLFGLTLLLSRKEQPE